MSLAARQAPIREAGRPGRLEPPEAETRLNVNVVFTSVGATLAALRRAAEIAGPLAVRIVLLVPQVSPYPLPLRNRPVLVDWNKRRFHVIAKQRKVETRVQLYRCHDRMRALCAVLKPHSLVVLGGGNRWWPTWESRLARALRRAGHEVIFAEAK
jgi:hypothetical protein